MSSVPVAASSSFDSFFFSVSACFVFHAYEKDDGSVVKDKVGCLICPVCWDFCRDRLTIRCCNILAVV